MALAIVLRTKKTTNFKIHPQETLVNPVLIAWDYFCFGWWVLGRTS